VAKEARGGEPKRQHYVPRFYLKGFVGQKNRLFVINRPTERTFRTTPDNVAAENYFNRIEVEGMDPNQVEKVLAEFEGETAPALERIKAVKSLANEEDRAALVNLIASIALRNPWRREAIRAIYEEAGRRQLDAMFGTKEAWQKSVAELKAAGVWNEAAGVTFEDMQEALKNAKPKIPKELNIAIEIDLHDHLTELLWNRKWQVVVAADGSGGFVTTDDPACLRWTDGQLHGGLSPGFGLKETEIIFPLSTPLALRGSFEGEENVVEADAAMVATINALIISNAQNQVYAHDHSFKLTTPSSLCVRIRRKSGAAPRSFKTGDFWRLGRSPQKGKSSRYGPNRRRSKAVTAWSRIAGANHSARPTRGRIKPCWHYLQGGAYPEPQAAG
jgi:hypothetical protein